MNWSLGIFLCHYDYRDEAWGDAALLPRMVNQLRSRDEQDRYLTAVNLAFLTADADGGKAAAVQASGAVRPLVQMLLTTEQDEHRIQVATGPQANQKCFLPILFVLW